MSDFRRINGSVIYQVVCSMTVVLALELDRSHSAVKFFFWTDRQVEEKHQLESRPQSLWLFRAFGWFQSMKGWLVSSELRMTKNFCYCSSTRVHCSRCRIPDSTCYSLLSAPMQFRYAWRLLWLESVPLCIDRVKPKRDHDTRSGYWEAEIRAQVRTQMAQKS